MTDQRRHPACVIPGDNAAPEEMAASLRGTDALDLPIDWDHVPVGTGLALSGSGKLTNVC